MARMSEKQLKLTIENLYNHWFDRVPVNMMKLGEIKKEIREIYLADDSFENKNAQCALLVDKYRVVIK